METWKHPWKHATSSSLFAPFSCVLRRLLGSICIFHAWAGIAGMFAALCPTGTLCRAHSLGTSPHSFSPWAGSACPSPAAECCSPPEQCSYSWAGSNFGWVNSILRNNSWQADRKQFSRLECLFYMHLITSSCVISSFSLSVVLGQVVVWKS